MSKKKKKKKHKIAGPLLVMVTRTLLRPKKRRKRVGACGKSEKKFLLCGAAAESVSSTARGSGQCRDVDSAIALQESPCRLGTLDYLHGSNSSRLCALMKSCWSQQS